MVEAVNSSETFVITFTITRCINPKDQLMNFHISYVVHCSKYWNISLNLTSKICAQSALESELH
jgi:hypothetical protein